jgi:TRAP-type C4-dicarboxylate transport system permease small subunit
MRIKYEKIQNILTKKLQSRGCSYDQSVEVGREIARNSLEGNYTHGINRFARLIRNIDEGIVIPNVRPTLVSGFEAIERYDGNLGLGVSNALFTMKRAIELAKRYGIGLVALKNTNHWIKLRFIHFTRIQVYKDLSMNKILQKVSKAYQFVAIVFLLTLFISVFIQIIMRNFFNSGSIQLEELARFSMISLVFITIPILTLESKHIVVDFLISHFSKRIQRWISVITQLLVTFFGLYILNAIASIMQRNWNVRTPGLNMPNILFYLPIIFGILAMTVFSLAGAWNTLTNKEDKA